MRKTGFSFSRVWASCRIPAVAGALLMSAACTDRSVPLLADEKWGLEWEAPGRSPVYGISIPDPQHAFAVGRDGLLISYVDGAWKNEGGVASNSLWDVYAADGTHAWAVGESGTVVSYDGAKWTAVQTGVSENLRTIAGAGSDRVWAAGDNGAMLFFDGTRWSTQQTGTRENLLGCTALDSNHAWASGSGGVVVFWDGNSWARQDTGVSDAINSVAAADRENVWAVTEGGEILHFNGTAWSKAHSARGTPLKGVWAVSKNRVFAVGADSTILLFDGFAWRPGKSDLIEKLWAVAAVRQGDSWGAMAVGEGGAVISTGEAGDALFVPSTQNVDVDNKLGKKKGDLTFGNYSNPYCVKGYTYPGRIQPNAYGTICITCKGSGFKCAFSDTDLYTDIRIEDASIGHLRISKACGAIGGSWSVWIEAGTVAPGYDIQVKAGSIFSSADWTVTVKSY